MPPGHFPGCNLALGKADPSVCHRGKRTPAHQHNLPSHQTWQHEGPLSPRKRRLPTAGFLHISQFHGGRRVPAEARSVLRRRGGSKTPLGRRDQRSHQPPSTLAHGGQGPHASTGALVKTTSWGSTWCQKVTLSLTSGVKGISMEHASAKTNLSRG